MVKRWLIGVAVFFVLLSSCAHTDSSKEGEKDELFQTEDYLSEYDMQPFFTRLSQICESQEAIFFQPMGGVYIWYYDKESGVSGKLCGKPECTHDSNDCNALAHTSFLSYYDGMIYFSGESRASDDAVRKQFPYGLYRMTPQGTERVYVQDIHMDISGNAFVVIHRGYLYMMNMIDTIESGKQRSYLLAVRQNLETSSSEPEILYQEEIVEGMADFRCILSGNHMYLLIQKYHVKDRLQDESVFLYDISLRDTQVKLMAKASFDDGNLTTGFSIYERKPVFVRCDPYMQRDDIQMYAFSEEKTEFALLGEAHPGRPYYSYVGDGVIMGIASAENPAVRPYLITDINGRILEEGVITLEEESKEAAANIVTASRDHLMVDFTAYIPSEVPGQVKSMHSIMELDFSDKGNQTYFLHGQE